MNNLEVIILLSNFFVAIGTLILAYLSELNRRLYIRLNNKKIILEGIEVLDVVENLIVENVPLKHFKEHLVAYFPCDSWLLRIALLEEALPVLQRRKIKWILSIIQKPPPNSEFNTKERLEKEIRKLKQKLLSQYFISEGEYKNFKEKIKKGHI